MQTVAQRDGDLKKQQAEAQRIAVKLKALEAERTGKRAAVDGASAEVAQLELKVKELSVEHAAVMNSIKARSKDHLAAQVCPL